MYLTVWESIEPEVILYEKLVQVNQVQSETGFYNYELEDIVVVSNDFFVGFTQTTTNNLNVGFDLSWTSTENSLYYDAGSGWNPSIFQGALMIRPIFANSSISEEPIVNEVDEEVQIFPNPLISGNLNLAINNGQDYKLVIFNLLGKLVYETQFKNEINLDFLPEGVYLLRFENQLNGEVKSQKLIRRK